MELRSTLYRDWSEKLRPSAFACWPIARTGVMLVLRGKLFWILLAIAAFSFLFMFAMIYAKWQIATVNPGFERFLDRLFADVDGTGETYRNFMFLQGTVTAILLMLAGSILIGDDMREGGLTFYLSRRIASWHYVVGKLLAIGLLVSLTTTLPALLLYLEYGLMSGTNEYFMENMSVLRGILGYGLLMSVAMSLLLVAMASWLQKTVPLVMSFACLFFFLPIIARILHRAYDNRQWLLLNYWQDIRLLGTWCFGAVDSDREIELLGPAAFVVVTVCVLSLVAIIPRVRAVRVVQ